MRLYETRGSEETLERLLADASIAESVAVHRLVPPRPAVTLPIPDWLDPRLTAALSRRGITSLYSHQAEAIDAVRGGEDIVVVTPTASGKSLCYNLPVLQAIADDPAARALYLFPTKALSQDQLAELRELASLGELDLEAGVYDGDTPAPIRSIIRAAGQIVVTNPDMLHSAILPHHTKWFQLFEQLRYVVVDEAHIYRGVFGSHVANVLRRLVRICAHYGSKPRIVCCSATIGNPGELAETLTGRRDAGHRPQRRARRARSTSSSSIRRPSTCARASGRDRSGCRSAAALTFLRAGRQTIVFAKVARGRRAAAHRPAEALRDGRGPLERVRGYRGGYLPIGAARDRGRPAHRRGARRGQHQRARAGHRHRTARRGHPGRLPGHHRRRVAADGPRRAAPGRQRGHPRLRRIGVDQYVATHPDYLFEASPEEARLDPENLHVLLAHLRAATFELPFDPGDRFGSADTDDLLAFLAEEGHVRQADDGRWYWASENFPASEISLRVAVAGERGDHRYGRAAAARHRRGGPVRGADARPRQRDLPPRVAPVPRRPPRLGASARRTSTRSTSSTTPRRSWRSRSSRSRCSTRRRCRTRSGSTAR